MRHLGARARGNQGGNPGIAEKVQHPDLPPGTADQRIHLAPVRGLFGKDANMPERGEPTEIVDAVMPHRPGLAEHGLGKAPAAHALLVGVAGEDRVDVVPVRLRQGTGPDRLTFGPHDAVGPVLLQLFAAS